MAPQQIIGQPSATKCVAANAGAFVEPADAAISGLCFAVRQQ